MSSVVREIATGLSVTIESGAGLRSSTTLWAKAGRHRGAGRRAEFPREGVNGDFLAKPVSSGHQSNLATPSNPVECPPHESIKR
jgi:hypothetical protein